MRRHRDLLRGTGFWPSLKFWARGNKITPDVVRELKSYNFLDIKDQRLVDLLMDQALPVDRARLRRYLEDRFLGLALVTAVSLDEV